MGLNTIVVTLAFVLVTGVVAIMIEEVKERVEVFEVVMRVKHPTSMRASMRALMCSMQGSVSSAFGIERNNFNVEEYVMESVEASNIDERFGSSTSLG